MRHMLSLSFATTQGRQFAYDLVNSYMTGKLQDARYIPVKPVVVDEEGCIVFYIEDGAETGTSNGSQSSLESPCNKPRK